MNFDKLPCDIKRKIFDYNREAAMREKNQLIFGITVMEELIFIFHGGYTIVEDGEVMDTVDVHYDYRGALMNIKKLRDEEAEDPFGSDSEWDYGEIDVAAEYREMVRE